MLPSHDLVHPRKHIAYVASRIVRVQFNGSRQAAGASARQGLEKSGQQRLLSNLLENLK